MAPLVSYVSKIPPRRTFSYATAAASSPPTILQFEEEPTHSTCAALPATCCHTATPGWLCCALVLAHSSPLKRRRDQVGEHRYLYSSSLRVPSHSPHPVTLSPTATSRTPSALRSTFAPNVERHILNKTQHKIFLEKSKNYHILKILRIVAKLIDNMHTVKGKLEKRTVLARIEQDLITSG
ncbi:hypothetical protein NDU88_004640 [Pleurodeles waltl]|uniref:Uncharacterized protein n=1 Tax=Pleurodeles waltl TaxID=8319 RepID=A0AAV7WYW0_PLEWA|nr:hypothetical protein NDU88_004640 [Pleurodeles waltl]